MPGARHRAECCTEKLVPATALSPRCSGGLICQGRCRNGLWGKLDGSQIAKGVRLARLVGDISKGSDTKDPEYL